MRQHSAAQTYWGWFDVWPPAVFSPLQQRATLQLTDLETIEFMAGRNPRYGHTEWHAVPGRESNMPAMVMGNASAMVWRVKMVRWWP